jgi:hydroxyethylthiazole kinase-like uncharacterized protein yjeF
MQHLDQRSMQTAPSKAPRHPVQVIPVTRNPTLPLHGVAATRDVEAVALASEPDGALMRRAGLAVANWARAMKPHARRWWVASGPGGNGGDGSYAASHLARAGLDVSLTVYADPDRLPRSTAMAVEDAKRAGVSIVPGPLRAKPPDAVIDALLGIGTTRAPCGLLVEGLRALAGSNAPCLSIDLPSGLDPDSGRTHGDLVVSAYATLSLLTLKPGLLTGAGRRYAGQVWLDSLGWDVHRTLDGRDLKPKAHLLGFADAWPPWTRRTHEQHKGHFGDAVVIGGAKGMPGAARLAAHAALAAGAGRTLLVSLESIALGGDPLRPELMCSGPERLNDTSWLARATAICGCGGGQMIAEALPKVLAQAHRVVLDADALNALSGDAGLQAMLERRTGAGLQTIMTPHPLEAARLLGRTVADVQADRLQAALDLSTRWQCTAVLKGSGTVISTPGLTPAINPTGGPVLSSGGTGDVLAGWMGGLWAQAPASATADPRTAHEVACASVWQHGHAAQLAFDGMPAARALDLIESMRSVGRHEGSQR